MTHYLFLDGACLRARLDYMAQRYCDDGLRLTIYWEALGPYRKIFYYDALPTKRPQQSDDDFNRELSEVEQLHAKLARLDRFRVNEGDARYRKGRGLEQKRSM